MIIYILATPIFSMILPLIAFWNMDDFSWGNTRMVTGEKGKQVLVSDEGKFDPDTIPKKKWEEYQAELWDAQSQRGDDARSEISGVSYGTKSYHPAQSEYGYAPSHHMSSLNVPAMPYHGSHMSMAYSDHGMMQQRNFSGSDLDMSDLPSDDAILAEIRDILRTSDLMNVTKKSIKAELERRFGVSLDPKRQYIGSAVEAVLNNAL